MDRRILEGWTILESSRLSQVVLTSLLYYIYSISSQCLFRLMFLHFTRI